MSVTLGGQSLVDNRANFVDVRPPDYSCNRRGVAVTCARCICALAGQGRGAASPASKPPPATGTPQSYPPIRFRLDSRAMLLSAAFVMVATPGGENRGRISSGRPGGPGRARRQAGTLIREGVPTRACPDEFERCRYRRDRGVHSRYASEGRVARRRPPRRRRGDLQTGNSRRGRQFFNGAGGCAKCHSLTSGDFAKIGSRYQGLALLHRLLYPGSGARDSGPAPARPTATVTTRDGQVVSGKLVAARRVLGFVTGRRRLDAVVARQTGAQSPLTTRFRPTLINSASTPTKTVHDVFAYLQTLK